MVTKLTFVRGSVCSVAFQGSCITLQPKQCANDRFLRLVTVYTHTLVLRGFRSDVMCARYNHIS